MKMPMAAILLSATVAPCALKLFPTIQTWTVARPAYVGA